MSEGKFLYTDRNGKNVLEGDKVRHRWYPFWPGSGYALCLHEDGQLWVSDESKPGSKGYLVNPQYYVKEALAVAA